MDRSDQALNPSAPAARTVMLASNSPRRRELLALIVPDFVIAQPREVEEAYPADMPAHEVPAFLSRLKAQAYLPDLLPGEVIITADTVVINRGVVLGKPHDRQQAVDMLKSLADHTHSVVTGVTLTTAAKSVTFAETTEVTFAPLTIGEIDHYVDKYRPYDKAGAYGIQEWIGCIGISGISGCFYNVMGLPLHSLYRHLKAL